MSRTFELKPILKGELFLVAGEALLRAERDLDIGELWTRFAHENPAWQQFDEVEGWISERRFLRWLMDLEPRAVTELAFTELCLGEYGGSHGPVQRDMWTVEVPSVRTVRAS